MQRGRQINRVFHRVAVGRARLEPVAVGKTDNLAVILGNQVGQSFGQHVGAPRRHFSHAGGLGFKGAGAVEHMMGVDGGDGGEVIFAAGAYVGHGI